MQTEEAELLALAEDTSADGTDRTAVLIDLSSIPHISDPIFFRTLIARIDVVPANGTSRMYRLSHHIVAIVAPDDQIHLAIRAVEKLDAFLKRSGRGAARHQELRLATESAKIAKICRKLMTDAGPRPDRGKDQGELASFMRLFESLRNADIANLVREQTIWDLSQLNEPKAQASALTVSIDALDDMFGQDIRANPWLFEKVIEVIDIRMLDHLVDDRLKAGKTYAVNVNSTVVIEGELDDSFAAIPMTTRKRILLEVPYVEALHERADFDRMVTVLEHEKFPVALDGIRWSLQLCGRSGDPGSDYTRAYPVSGPGRRKLHAAGAGRDAACRHARGTAGAPCGRDQPHRPPERNSRQGSWRITFLCPPRFSCGNLELDLRATAIDHTFRETL